MNDEFIRNHDRDGNKAPPSINHQGIDDSVWDKASAIHYFYDGQWLSLQGAD